MMKISSQKRCEIYIALQLQEAKEVSVGLGSSLRMLFLNKVELVATHVRFLDGKEWLA